MAGIQSDQNNPCHEHHGYYRRDTQVWPSHGAHLSFFWFSELDSEQATRYSLLSLRLGFVDAQRASIQVAATQSQACFVRLACLGHFDKCKPFRTPSFFIITMSTRSTVPCASNRVRSCGSVALCGRLPTYRFLVFPRFELRQGLSLRAMMKINRLGLQDDRYAADVVSVFHTRSFRFPRHAVPFVAVQKSVRPLVRDAHRSFEVSRFISKL